MAEEATKRCAVVTGANKAVGFATVRQLASNGIIVITARDEKRVLEAAEKLQEFGLSDFVLFHQLDVTDPTSIASLADFLKTQFGKIDILVNNAGILRGAVDPEAFRSAVNGKNFPNGWAKEVPSDAESLTEERIEAVLSGFLEDCKKGLLETKSWPPLFSAYTLSKAGLSAYTRILANKYPNFCINCVCPGFVKTDLTCNTGFLTIDEGAESLLRLALLPDGGPTGHYIIRNEVTPF